MSRPTMKQVCNLYSCKKQMKEESNRTEPNWGGKPPSQKGRCGLCQWCWCRSWGQPKKGFFLRTDRRVMIPIQTIKALTSNFFWCTIICGCCFRRFDLSSSSPSPHKMRISAVKQIHRCLSMLLVGKSYWKRKRSTWFPVNLGIRNARVPPVYHDICDSWKLISV